MKDVTPTPGSDRIYYKHCHGRRGCDLRFVYMLCICCSLLLVRIKVIPSFVLHFDFFIRITLVMHNFLLQENELPLKLFLFSSGEASRLTIIYIKKNIKKCMCVCTKSDSFRYNFQFFFCLFLASVFPGSLVYSLKRHYLGGEAPSWKIFVVLTVINIICFVYYLVENILMQCTEVNVQVLLVKILNSYFIARLTRQWGLSSQGVPVLLI